PGAGKSTAMRAMLKQITERGPAAIVIDPESEYVQEFYSEERGDWILNPLDSRCPYWSPWSELRDDSFSVDAAAMAASLIRGTPAYALIDPAAHDQGAGILGTATNAIKTFIHLPRREENARAWSAREWAENRSGWIFLPSREDINEAIRVLQGLWLDCLVRW